MKTSRNKKITNIVTITILSIFFINFQIKKDKEQVHIDYYFNFLDKYGLECGYELEYDIMSQVEITDVQKDSIFYTTRYVVRNLGRKHGLEDFILKSDSIESYIKDNVISMNLNKPYVIEDIHFKNILIPEKIYNAFIEKGESEEFFKSKKLKKNNYGLETK